MSLIRREDLTTDIGRYLYDLLSACWNNPEFISGVLRRLKSEERKQEMIKLIEAGLIDSDDIIRKALEISGYEGWKKIVVVDDEDEIPAPYVEEE